MDISKLSIADLSTAIKFMKEKNKCKDCFKIRRTMDTGGDYDTHEERIKYHYDPIIIYVFENELKIRIDSVVKEIQLESTNKAKRTK